MLPLRHVRARASRGITHRGGHFWFEGVAYDDLAAATVAYTESEDSADAALAEATMDATMIEDNDDGGGSARTVEKKTKMSPKVRSVRWGAQIFPRRVLMVWSRRVVGGGRVHSLCRCCTC